MGPYRWYRSVLLIDTFGLIFIDVINPSVKDFLFLIDCINSRSYKSSLTDGHWSIDTHSIDSINQNYSLKNLPNFCHFCHGDEKTLNFCQKTMVTSVKIAKTLKGQLNFNQKSKDRYSFKKFAEFLPFFAMAMKKR